MTDDPAAKNTFFTILFSVPSPTSTMVDMLANQRFSYRNILREWELRPRQDDKYSDKIQKEYFLCHSHTHTRNTKQKHTLCKQSETFTMETQKTLQINEQWGQETYLDRKKKDGWKTIKERNTGFTICSFPICLVEKHTYQQTAMYNEATSLLESSTEKWQEGKEVTLVHRVCVDRILQGHYRGIVLELPFVQRYSTWIFR